MKQTWKKLTSLFLALACMVTLFTVPVYGAVDESLKSSIVQNLQSLVAMMSNYSEEEMLAQIESADSVFLNTMVEQYYDAVEEAGAFQEVTASNIVVDEEKKVATVTLKVAFEEYNGEITALCNYTASSTATSFDDLWSAFNMDIDYPISAMLKNAGLNTVMGIGIVFVVLIFLAYVIYLLKYVNKDGTGEAPKPEASPELVAEPIAEPMVEVPSIDEEVELAIVLSAAIAAYEEENTSGDGYVVRSIKKNQNKKWRRV